MLSLDPNDIYEEIRHAEADRDDHLKTFEEQVALYHGRAWKNSEVSAHENHSYEMASLLLPKLSYDNPACNVRSMLNTDDAEAAAAVIEQGLATWIRRTRYRTLGSRLALDELFNFSALAVQRVGSTRKLEPFGSVHLPGAKRIPQRMFGMDGLAHTAEESRFFFRKWFVDKEDLKRIARGSEEWNEAAIDELVEDAGLPNEWSKAPKRKQVALYDVWMRGRAADGGELPEGYSGTMLTVGAVRTTTGQTGELIRKPHNHWGHSDGPFVVGGCYSVPDSPWPLGMLSATYEQTKELNRQCARMAEEMDAYKRLALVDAMDTQLAKDIATQGNLFVIPVANLGSNKVIQLEVGGTTEQRVAYVQLLRDRLDRNSGMTDAQRGNVTGQGTATELNLAADAATARNAYIARQRADAATQCLERIAWYLFHDKQVVFTLDREAIEKLKDMGMGDVRVFRGGMFENVQFEDLELEISPYSMERVNEVVGQQRALQKLDMLLKAAPVMLQTPQIDWKKPLSSLGQAMNDPTYGEILDTDKLSSEQSRIADMQGAANAGV